jgi:SAM-dependent methyltransferase
VEIAPTGRALDLGCGRGEISVGMAGLGHEVLAIDYSESAVALARQAAAAAGALGSIRFFHGDVNQAPFEGSYEVVVASDLIEHLAPHELDRLYSRIASHLSPAGVFVVHTFPNAWHYRYEHPRRVRQARKLGAYLPMDPRSRYEELMHINEQSPRVLKNQLRDHFEHVLFWFADHSMVDPFANLKRPFSRDEMRSAGDLYAVASHFPITAGALVEKMAMRPVPAPVDLTLEVTGIPPSVAAGARFRGRIGLSNRSGIDLKSHPPNPVHLAYHCYSENGSVVVFDGMRTRLPSIKPGVRVELDMDFEAPVLPGRFLFRLTLVQEGVRWFDGPPQNLFSDHWIRVEGVRAQ